MPDPLELLPVPIDIDRAAALPIAEQFPGLRPGSHRFDAPGGTLTHLSVCQAVASYLSSEHVANDHGAFPASRFSTDLVAWAGDQMRTLLSADSGQIVFGLNMTTLTAMFLRASAGTIRPGDELLVTSLNHEANIQPWQALADSRGARLLTAPITPTGELSTEAVTDLLSERTRWVAVTAASNALGSVVDVAAITEAAHATGARVFVDAVQWVPHRPVRLQDWGCDALVTSAYKWYGPHCGVLWLADETAADCRLAEQVGSAGDELPGRLSLGTTPFESVFGTGVAAEVLSAWGFTQVTAREDALARVLLDGLAQIPQVRTLGPDARADRVPVVTFQIHGLQPDAAAHRLAEAGISVWHGTFYCDPAMRALSANGAPEALRAGIAAYTTREDVDALLTAVADLAKGAA